MILQVTDISKKCLFWSGHPSQDPQLQTLYEKQLH